MKDWLESSKVINYSHTQIYCLEVDIVYIRNRHNDTVYGEERR